MQAYVVSSSGMRNWRRTHRGRAGVGVRLPEKQGEGQDGARCSYEGHIGHSQGTEGSQRSLGPRSVLNIRGRRRVWIEWEDGEGWAGGVLHQ